MRRRWVRWLVGGALLATVLMAAVVWGRDQMALGQRRHQLGTLALACKFYAHDHAGAMPPDLRAVFPKYLNSPPYHAYAMDDVEYFPGATETMREKRPDRRGRRWVEHLDCSIGLVHPSLKP